MPQPQINVTPLIDVLLVLLIIFMVVTPMKPSSFQAKIPQEPTNESNIGPHPDTIIVSIGIDSTLKLNKDKTKATVQQPEKLTESLKETFRARAENLVSERTVFVKAPKKLDYGSVAKVVDAVKASGAEPISLQIDAIE
ncbi:MAG TPA: biopolymer transporter ExbD [Pyrinomonadaceae bacterium]|nr:biopolymer transporter ExbD [Pyrinomonadaceae bacterium]